MWRDLIADEPCFSWGAGNGSGVAGGDCDEPRDLLGAKCYLVVALPDGDRTVSEGADSRGFHLGGKPVRL